MGHPNPLRLVFERLVQGIRPPEPLPLSRWLAKNLVLVDGPLAGELWSPETAPYLAEIADRLSDDDPCTLVTIRKSQQTGASILALGWCLYVAEREPANLLYAIPGIDALRDLNAGKLQPLIEAWQRRSGKTVIVPQTSRSGTGSTTYEKVFPGGRIWLANANSVMDLSSKTAKKGVKDELSKWEDVPGHGDPETLFFGRFTAFRRERSWKVLEISTPEVDTGDDLGESLGHCRIDRQFKRSDQRFWNVTCPECEGLFVHSVERLRIDRASPHKTRYECIHCGHMISEAERVLAVKNGLWVPSVEGPDRHPGYHIDAFVSLMMSYEAIAEDAIKAEKSERAQKDFHNLVLGLPYKYRGDAPDYVRLMERREDYSENHVPADGLLLTAGADVQHSGIWVEVVAWGRDRQSWTVFARFLPGDTTDHTAGAFTALAEVLETRFVDAFGGQRTIDALGIDAGDGGRSSQVYSFTRKRPRAYAVKGMPGFAHPPIGSPTQVDIKTSGKRIRRGALLWPVGTWSLKAEHYAQLRKKGRMGGEEMDPPGYCHFGTFLDENYFKQITSEYLDDEIKRGRPRKIWRQTGENHLLDCRIYAMAMAEHLGLSRMTPEQWAVLVAQRGTPPATITQVDLVAPEPLRVAGKPPSDARDRNNRTSTAANDPDRTVASGQKRKPTGWLGDRASRLRER